MPAGLRLAFLRPASGSEEFDDLLDGEVHAGRVAEWVIGVFDFDEFDDVVVAELSGDLDRGHLVLRAVDHEDGFGVVHEVAAADVVGPEIVEEVFGELDLPVEAAEDLLALPELIPVLRGDAGGDGVVHPDRRAAEGDALKRVVAIFREIVMLTLLVAAMLRDRTGGCRVVVGGAARRSARVEVVCIGRGTVLLLRKVAEGDVGAEARGVVVDVLGVHGLLHVAGDEVEVGAALIEDQLVAGVLSVAGPVEADDAVAVVLRGEALGELLDGLVVLVAAEAVGRDDDVWKVVKVLIIVELAADAEAGFVNVEVFFQYFL